jgi:hypothetical protein
MSTEPQRTCPSCDNEFSGAMEFCPVCMLRKGLADGVESGESSASEDAVKPTAEQAAQRFEHYGSLEEGGAVAAKIIDLGLVARLRRARLLAAEDPHNPGHLDTHPLVREYFGEQLRSQRTEAWKECNRRLFNYFPSSPKS